jgi:hypothetical protein
LTSGALYLHEIAGTLWRTAVPTALPVNVGRPSLTASSNTLTCRRGGWRNADRFSYAWSVNGMAHKGAKPTLVVGKALQGRSATCSVTAYNADGNTTALSALFRVP